MPRYDRLVHDERKYVTVMPTWRKSLSSGTDARGVWQLGKEFQESEYFHFYDDLLNNERLLGAAEKYGYTICFMPHPNTIDGLHMFRHDPRVNLWIRLIPTRTFCPDRSDDHGLFFGCL